MPRDNRLVLGTLAAVFLISFTVEGQGFTPIRVNCGGSQYVDLQGVVWAADYGSRLTTSTDSTTTNITGTLSPGIYQTDRSGSTVLYTFSVPNGTYTVNLRFAEIHWTAAGQRTFSVALNQQWVLGNFDIIAQSGGPNRALDKSFTVTVTSGVIIIQLTASIDKAAINGIEITQTSPALVIGNSGGSTTPTTGTTGSTTPTTGTTGSTTPTTGTTGSTTPTTGTTGSTTPTTGTTGTTTPTTGTIGNTTPTGGGSTSSGTGTVTSLPAGSNLIRVNCAGNQYVDAQGAVWAADYGFSGASGTNVTAATITGTTTPALYQKERFGSTFLYTFRVPNGSYKVNLKFSEIYWQTPGQRLFHVAINGQWVLSNFDILGQAGGPNIALDKAFNIVVTTGAIIIQFTTARDNAKIDAIEILPQVLTTSTQPIQITQPVTPAVVQVAVSPSFATLNAGGRSQFNATVTGPSSTAVQWSITPPIGTISASGLYGAPSAISSAQTITVMATSLADTTKTASAAITLVPTASSNVTPTAPPITSVSPNQASLAVSQTQQFSVAGLPSAMGTGGTPITVSWSINPAVGGITQSGLYTAPGSISSQQTITVSAKDSTSSAILGTASVTLIPPPPPVPPAPTGFTTVEGNGQVTLSWIASPGATSYNVKRGTVSGGPYTTVGSGVTATTFVITGLVNGTTYYYVVSAVNASGEGPNSAQVNGYPSAPPTTTTIQLPLEVFGSDGTTVTASFTIPANANLSGQLQLWMQIHGLRYETEASVKVNNSSWIPINSSTVSLQGLANTYGGIGGGFSTLKMTLNLPAGVITTGSNTLNFRFNGTDGRTSGFRVLAFNIQGSDGSSLIPSSTFVNDDPNTWQPPSSNSSDIAAGQTLWRQAALTTPSSSGAQPIKARCSDCHAQDGRDLKYFNYSNNSIRARAMFHGLTSQQGDQIASYIRALNQPNPGRPWNPPYQPGPGMDSKPVSSWAAGAGLDAVLDSDAGMQTYLMPGGSTAGWAANQYLNVRELPIALQLADWNTWLPAVHPMDAFGAAFTNNPLNTLYGTLRGQLQANNTTAYAQALPNLAIWTAAQVNFLWPMESAALSSSWTPNLRTQIYAAAVWQMVKLWELNQEFGLEAMPQVPYGAKANVRGWYGSQSFATSPNMLHITPGAGLGNGSQISQIYLAYIWYHLQLILNDGQGQQQEHNIIDYPYVYGFVKALNWGNSAIHPTATPEAMLQMMWYVKALQELTLTGVGPQAGSTGWHAFETTPYDLIDSAWSGIWSATSPSTQTSVLQGYLQAWFAQASQYTAQQYYQGGWANAADNPATLNPLVDGTGWGGEIWMLLPRFRSAGVDANLTYQIANWAATIWPNGNWALNKSATCVPGGRCTSDH